MNKGLIGKDYYNQIVFLSPHLTLNEEAGAPPIGIPIQSILKGAALSYLISNILIFIPCHPITSLYVTPSLWLSPI